MAEVILRLSSLKGVEAFLVVKFVLWKLCSFGPRKWTLFSLLVSIFLLFEAGKMTRIGFFDMPNGGLSALAKLSLVVLLKVIYNVNSFFAYHLKRKARLIGVAKLNAFVLFLLCNENTKMRFKWIGQVRFATEKFMYSERVGIEAHRRSLFYLFIDYPVEIMKRRITLSTVWLVKWLLESNVNFSGNVIFIFSLTKRYKNSYLLNLYS